MGGRCFERLKDGGEQVWGKVLAFDRPHHIVIAWQISPDRTPEDSDATASRVDVRFSPGESRQDQRPRRPPRLLPPPGRLGEVPERHGLEEGLAGDHRRLCQGPRARLIGVASRANRYMARDGGTKQKITRFRPEQT